MLKSLNYVLKLLYIKIIIYLERKKLKSNHSMSWILNNYGNICINKYFSNDNKEIINVRDGCARIKL